MAFGVGDAIVVGDRVVSGESMWVGVSSVLTGRGLETGSIGEAMGVFETAELRVRARVTGVSATRIPDRKGVDRLETGFVKMTEWVISVVVVGATVVTVGRTIILEARLSLRPILRATSALVNGLPSSGSKVSADSCCLVPCSSLNF